MRRRTVAAAVALAAILLGPMSLPHASAASRSTTQGTSGSDRLVGTPERDLLLGLGGNDVLVGRSGDDSAHGGPGADAFHGGQGADTFWGGAGADFFVTGHGHETAYLWRGGDEIVTGLPDGLDVFHCGPGQDTVVYSGRADPADVLDSCENVVEFWKGD